MDELIQKKMKRVCLFILVEWVSIFTPFIIDSQFSLYLILKSHYAGDIDVVRKRCTYKALDSTRLERTGSWHQNISFYLIGFRETF